MQNIISGAHIPTPNYATPEAVRAALREIGIDGGRYKKWFAAQYVTDIAGLGDCLPVYPNLSELNLLAHIILEMECEDIDIFEAALESGDYKDMESIINLSLNLDCWGFIPGVEDDEELGRWHVEGFDFCDVPGIGEFLTYRPGSLWPERAGKRRRVLCR